MFNWGQSLYYALRVAIIGAFVGFLLSIIISATGGKGNAGTVVIRMFWLFGIVRLGWDLFSKKYPDA